jgi:hypothetical protein
MTLTLNRKINIPGKIKKKKEFSIRIKLLNSTRNIFLKNIGISLLSLFDFKMENSKLLIAKYDLIE